MHIADINPHIRFAEEITYALKNRRSYVKDCRIFYVLGGRGSIRIQEKEYILKENTLFYCAGGQEYSINAEDYLHFYALNFDLSQAHRALVTPFAPVDLQTTSPTGVVDLCLVEDSGFLDSFFIAEHAGEFKNGVATIVKEFATQQLFFRETAGAVLKKILIDLHKMNTDAENNSASAVQKITEYIQLHYMEEIKNSALAELVGYHEYYLNRCFVQYTSMSMHKYVLNLRIAEGKRLLLNTDLSVANIAVQVGFNSAAHFSAYFKKETDASPLEYRSSFKHRI